MKKIMKIVILVCLLSSTLIGCGGLSTEETFETFKCEAGEFSVDFPGTPTDQSQTVKSPIGDIGIDMYMVEKKHIAYVCGYNDYPEDFVKNNDVNLLLVNAANGAVSTVNGKNAEIQDITLGEYPGKDLKFEAEKDGNKMKMHQKIFFVGNRMYQMNVATDKEDDYKENINKFFDSFKLINK